MSWLTAAWLVIASACATLAAIHLYVWFRQRQARANLAFAVFTLSITWLGYLELGQLHAETPEEFGRYLWWVHIPVWTALVALVLFVRLYLRAGRAWLAGAAIGLRTVTLIVNFFSAPNVNFREIAALDHITVFGDALAIAVGTPSPWLTVAHLALFALVAFVADATWVAWRRGERRRALIMGVPIALYVTAATSVAILSYWGLARIPVFGMLLFIPFVLAMGFELSLDLLRTARLAAELDTRTLEVEHLARLATLTELSGALAHELNQPLAIIMSNAEAAQRMLRTPDPDIVEIRAILDDIVTADARAGEVIARMRGMLKRGVPNRQPTLLNPLVEDVLRFMRAELIRRGVTVETALGPDVRPVRADRVPLEQVLINIIGNACDAMRENAPGDRIVRIATSAAAGEAHLVIGDCGPGLPQDLERVFAPFYTTKPDGLGMGLAISRSIVVAHGGRLSAEATSDRGARFRIVLPVLQGES